MEDLIRRSDALACFHDWVDEHGYIHEADEMTEYQAIANLPSAIENPTQSNAPNTLKALTNADSIRSMTDEEMAEWMAKYCERKTVFCPNFGAHDCQESCEQCWLDWLRTEVTE